MRIRFLFALLIIVFGTTGLLAASQDLTAEGKKNLRSANMHLGGERFEKALPLYEEVLKENPNHIEAMQKVAGILYEVDQNFKEADIYYQNILKEIDAIYAEYEEMKKTDKKAAKKFHKKYIKKADLEEIKANTIKLRQSCWVKMFNAAKDETDPQASIEDFEYVYSIAPDSIQTVKMLAFKYNEAGDEDKTLEFLIKAAEMEPSDDMARTQIGNTYFQKEDFENAIKWYMKAIDVNNENLDNHYNMALAYDRMNNEEKALETYLKVHEIDPQNINIIVNISNKYSKMDNLEKSMEFLKKAVDLDPENVEYISFYCWKLSQAKMYDELLVYAQKWLELQPDSEDAKNLINLAKQMKK